MSQSHENPLRLQCADLESLLADYVDNTLPAAERTAVDAHLAGCVACQELLEDSRAAIAFMERCQDPVPPPELITKIVHQLPAAKASTRRRRGVSAWLARLFAPILQPKFAMGMAMTILSFSMIGKFVGPVKPLRPADLDPVRVVATIDDKLHRLWNDAIKYYESLRWVYEIQTRIREMNEEREAEETAAPSPAPAPAQTKKGK